MQVLIVEDEKRLAKALRQILMEQKYMVDMVHDGNDGLDYALSGIYDVIILDIMLPYRDGYSVAYELRKQKIDTPILMLTAKDTVPDKVSGLNSGADDYMTKPFSPAELLAHLRALTRRTGQVIFENLEFGDLKLNLESHDLSREGKSINLSFKEFSILEILMANRNQIVSKETLISKVWGVESTAVDNNVEAYISFIRKKLKHLGTNVQIETVRGVGYRLVEGA